MNERRRQFRRAQAGAVVVEQREDAERAGRCAACRFYEHLPRLYSNPQARSWYETTPEAIRTTALRNATLQVGRVFHDCGPRAGLDCGPMSGFNNDKADAEFFPDGRFKSNFLCCLGYGDSSNMEPRLYRFAFDEVCKIL